VVLLGGDDASRLHRGASRAALLLDAYNANPGKLQLLTAIVLLRYCLARERTFAVFGLPRIGPLLGPTREYRLESIRTGVL
jgi:hypothetical protein